MRIVSAHKNPLVACSFWSCIFRGVIRRSHTHTHTKQPHTWCRIFNANYTGVIINMMRFPVRGWSPSGTSTRFRISMLLKCEINGLWVCALFSYGCSVFLRTESQIAKKNNSITNIHGNQKPWVDFRSGEYYMEICVLYLLGTSIRRVLCAKVDSCLVWAMRVTWYIERTIWLTVWPFKVFVLFA